MLAMVVFLTGMASKIAAMSLMEVLLAEKLKVFRLGRWGSQLNVLREELKSGQNVMRGFC